jgi:hypothetical protein
LLLRRETNINDSCSFPVPDDDCGSINFKIENNGIKVLIILANRKAECIISISGTELWYCSWNWKPCCYILKALHLPLTLALFSICGFDKLTTPQIATPAIEKPRRRLSGPALVKVAPIPRKRLVPIVPPIAMS